MYAGRIPDTLPRTILFTGRLDKGSILHNNNNNNNNSDNNKITYHLNIKQ